MNTKDKNTINFYMRLPRNKREFALFITIISVLSVNIIAPLISMFEMGFSFNVWVHTLKIIPFIWLCVIALVLLIYKPAVWLTEKIVAKDDSFNSQVTIHTMCSVFFMSIFLTIIGAWIGAHNISIEPIQHFFFRWPRNVAIAFVVECLFAQPIARMVIYKMHLSMDPISN